MRGRNGGGCGVCGRGRDGDCDRVVAIVVALVGGGDGGVWWIEGFVVVIFVVVVVVMMVCGGDSISGAGLCVPPPVRVGVALLLLLLRVVEIVVIWGCLLAGDLPVRRIACPRSFAADQTVLVGFVWVLLPLFCFRVGGGFGLFFVAKIFWGLELPQPLLAQVAVGVVFWLPRCVEPIAVASLSEPLQHLLLSAIRCPAVPLLRCRQPLAVCPLKHSLNYRSYLLSE